MRAYATQVEVLRRLRSGGQQLVRVEHVHVNDGGQAVIGNVKKQDYTLYKITRLDDETLARATIGGPVSGLRADEAPGADTFRDTCFIL